MSARHWTRRGTTFEIEWGGDRWLLEPGRTRPGLIQPERKLGPLLAAGGLASLERRSDDAFGSRSLVGHEIHRDRLEATYRFSDWGGMTVRLAWSPFGEHGVDLEAQLQADSVGELRRVEVELLSALPFEGEFTETSTRDLHISHAESENSTYIEMVHPDDLSRVVASDETVRRPRSLFGYDLEKGVVLRARARAFRLPGKVSPAVVSSLRDAFLAEPLPLGV